MTPQAPIGETRRGFRRWKILLGGIVLLPLIGFLLSNLLLTSPWVRGWLAGKISNKTGLETSIASAEWSPWGGLALSRIELRQPPPLRAAIHQPLLKIDSLRLAPVWKSWLRGRFEVHSISLENPAVTLPLELVAHLSTPQIAAPPSAPKVTTAAPAAIIPAAPRVADAHPKSLNSAPTSPLSVLPTRWIHLTNASLSIVSVSASQPLFSATQITGSLPIAGGQAQSPLAIGKVTSAGQTTDTHSRAELRWKAPLLTLEPYSLSINKIKATLAVQLAMLSHLPIQVSAQFPNQVLPTIPLPRDGQANAESFAVNASFRGLMLAPSTWQGECLAQVISPTLRFGTHTAQFDRGSSITVLRGGAISCIDARLMSDEISILGNATLLSSGNLAAACRIVAPPQNLGDLARFVFPNLESPALTPLSTPQRAAFDLFAFGNLQNLYLQLGKDGPILPLKTTP